MQRFFFSESTQEVQLKPLASSDLLRHRMQELVSEINSKRQRDNALLQGIEEFRC